VHETQKKRNLDKRATILSPIEHHWHQQGFCSRKFFTLLNTLAAKKTTRILMTAQLAAASHMSSRKAPEIEGVKAVAHPGGRGRGRVSLPHASVASQPAAQENNH
jgi:hypothetical protein